MRPHTIPPRAALELRRFDDAAAKDADGVRLADSVLFHLVDLSKPDIERERAAPRPGAQAQLGAARPDRHVAAGGHRDK